MQKVLPKTMLVGGGSGGHISVIKGLLAYIRQQGYSTDNFIAVGGKLAMAGGQGMNLDEKLLQDCGVRYELIRAGKLQRGWRKDTLRLFLGFFPGLFDALSLLRRERPDVIFASGGYVSLPIAIWAWVLGIKLFLHEATLSAGLANRIAARFATKVLLTFEESRREFPRNKSILTGNIIRQEILAANPSSIPVELKQTIEQAHKNQQKIIYITGGGQGAHKINEFILQNLATLTAKYTLIWQTGENQYFADFEQIQTALTEQKINNVYLSKFIKGEIGYVLANCDLAISRCGANTLYEFAVTKIKAILIPLWITAKNDQDRNAKWYEQNYVGKLIYAQDLTIKKLFDEIERMLGLEFKGPEIDYRDAADNIFKALYQK